MPVKARAGGQGRVRTGRVGGQTGSGSSPGSPAGILPLGLALLGVQLIIVSLSRSAEPITKSQHATVRLVVIMLAVAPIWHKLLGVGMSQ
jgi:hypothetical protein